MPNKQLAAISQLLVLVLMAAVFFRIRTTDASRYRHDYEAIRGLGLLEKKFGVLSQDAWNSLRRVVVQSHLLDKKDGFPLDDLAPVGQRLVEMTTAMRQSVASLAPAGSTFFTNDFDITAALVYAEVPSSRALFGKPDQVGDEESTAKWLDVAETLGVLRYRYVTKIHADRVRIKEWRENHILGNEPEIPNIPADVGKLTIGIKALQDRSNALPSQPEMLVVYRNSNRQFVAFYPVEVSQPLQMNALRPTLWRTSEAAVTRLLPEDNLRIRRLYGTLTLPQAAKVSEASYLRTHDSVEMLGFKFSPDTFWVYVTLANLFLLLAAVVHIAHSPADDEVGTFGLSAIMDRGATRIILWLVVPIGAAILSTPYFSRLQSMWVGIASVPVILCGVICVYQYRKRN